MSFRDSEEGGAMKEAEEKGGEAQGEEKQREEEVEIDPFNPLVQGGEGPARAHLEVAEGQPFYLRLMRRLLEQAGDRDCGFFDNAEVGLPLGIKFPLPRTRQSFERQVDLALS
eukprot:s708_g25.t1